MPIPGYTVGDHPSDLELIVRGRTCKEIFAEAARGVIEYAGPNPGADPLPPRTIRLVAADREELLVIWLNEIVYLLETGFVPDLPVRIERLSETELETTLPGRPINREKPASGPEVKAATYHGLSIRRDGPLWEARVILDL